MLSHLKFDFLIKTDFSVCQTQLLDKVRMRLGQVPMDTEETNKTADSTFKPKSLRNRAKERADALVAADREREEAEEKKRRREEEATGGAVNNILQRWYRLPC